MATSVTPFRARCSSRWRIVARLRSGRAGLARSQVRGFILSPYPAASTIAFISPPEYAAAPKVGGTTILGSSAPHGFLCAPLSKIPVINYPHLYALMPRSEERRVGKECG